MKQSTETNESKMCVGDVRNPDLILIDLWTKIPNSIKITFAAAFVFFLLIHMFMLTNKFPNHDDIRLNFFALHLPELGRPFSFVQTMLRSTFSMPWLIGVFSGVYLAFSACFIVACFRIKKTVNCLLTSLIVVSFPTIASTLSYMQFADSYFLSVLLICAGAYFSNRFKFGFLVAIVLFTLSLGIYQAYFPLGAAIMVGILILDILELKSFRHTVIKSICFLAALGLSVVLYLIIVDLTTDYLSAYMDIDQMGRVSLSDFPRLIRNAYTNAFAFVFENSRYVHNIVTQYAFVATAVVATLIALVNIPKVFLNDKRQFVFYILLLIALPLAANLIEVMGVLMVHVLMIYGLIILPIFVIAMFENHSRYPPPH